jgi:Zn-dependent protease with chaperone function
MISAALLVVAVATGTLGSRLLEKAAWTLRAPALAILAWQALTWSVLTSLMFAGASLALPRLPAGDTVAGFFHACSVALRHHYSTPGGGALAVLGGSLAILLLGRLGYFLLRYAHQERAARAAHADLLGYVGVRQDGVVVVDHPSPAVYCFPGRGASIVVTTAARDALTSTQLRQVLAHERAHLRARHHLALLAARSVAATLGGRLGSATAVRQVADLVEMHADDAADSLERPALARALVLLASGSAPATSLAAATTCTLLRVQRLARPAVPVSYRVRGAIMLAMVLLLIAPLAIASAPLLAEALLKYCPLPLGV